MTISPTGFTAYGASHCGVLALFFIITISMILIAHRCPSGKTARNMAWLLAALLILTILSLLTYGVIYEPQKAVDLLPMHLCDWLAFTAIAALVWRKQLFYEITYFLGLAGTLQGLITPDLRYDYPHFYFFAFFLVHAGILTTVFYMTFGLKMRPNPISLVRAFIFIQFYMICAFLTNWLLGTNYGYLQSKPENPSLLDHLGPWPWYLLSMQGLAILLFLIYYAPWWWVDHRKAKKAIIPPPGTNEPC
ncbi:MAG: TIGR02206 family membrane protein [Blastochloris sp.]|nr:TIGR02206 family membrane protein [Blastochloris sp.]